MLPIFITHYLGFPLSGSPLTFLHPKLLVDWYPYPSEKGRGRCGWAAGICWWYCKLRTSHIICRNVIHSHVIIICLHKHSCGLIFSKSNHLPLPPTFITCASSSQNMSQVWKHLSMPFKQHRYWPHLPLPLLFSALIYYLISSIKNFSLPYHLTLSIKNVSSTLHPPFCHITWCWPLRMPLVCHCPLCNTL